MATRRLAMNVIKKCAAKLKAAMDLILESLMSGNRSDLKPEIDYHRVLYDFYQWAPDYVLSRAVPRLTRKLMVINCHKWFYCNLYNCILNDNGTFVCDSLSDIYKTFFTFGRVDMISLIHVNFSLF